MLSRTPHKDFGAKEAMDFAMSATAFGHQVNVLFIDDGVYQLLPSKATDTEYKIKQTAKIAKSMPFFDVENTYVCQQSLTARQIDNNDIEASFDLIDVSSVRELIKSHTFTVNL